MKQSQWFWLAAGAAAIYFVSRQTGPAAAGAPESDEFDFGGFTASPSPFNPTPIPTPTPQPVGGFGLDFPPEDEFAFEGFGPGDDFVRIDVVELGVEAGKSLTRTVVGTIDPLAQITRLIPGVPTVGGLYTPVDKILDFF